MTGLNVILAIAIVRSLSCMAAIAAAAHMAANNQPYGWMVFAAICLGCYGVTTK